MNLKSLPYESIEASAIRCFAATFPSIEEELKSHYDYDSYADYCKNCGEYTVLSYCVYRDLLNYLQTVETVSLQFNDLLEKNAAFSSFLHDEERESNAELFRTL